MLHARSLLYRNKVYGTFLVRRVLPAHKCRNGFGCCKNVSRLFRIITRLKHLWVRWGQVRLTNSCVDALRVVEQPPPK